MWPFKKQRSLSEIPPRENDKWVLSEGEYAGSPLFVRHNTTAVEWKGNKNLGIKLGFAIPFNSSDAQGLPDLAENERVGDIEDLIESEVFAVTSGIFAMILTTGKIKEFVFYIPEGVDIGSIHKRVRDKVQGHEVQCKATRESDWSSFIYFVNC